MYRHDLKDIKSIEPTIPVKIDYLNEQTLSKISQVKKLNLDRLKKRLYRGDLCFTSNYQGRVVSYHWLQTTGQHYIQQAGKLVDVEAGEAFVYHVRVGSEYRGNKINGYVYLHILNYCKREKLNKVWVYTNVNNKNNRKGLEAMGFKIDHFIFSIKMGRKYHQLFKRYRG